MLGYEFEYVRHIVKITPEELGRINASGDQPKFLQIAERIRELIDSGRLSLGDRLPSVNEIIAHFSVSRDTAVKAYQALKDRGIIETTPSKACFVSNVFLQADLKKILLLVDWFSGYKEKMYHGLIDTLDQGYYVDIMTHSDNFDILKTVYEKYKGMLNCAALLVIPTAGQSREEDYFKYINPGKLLFIDRRIPGLAHPAVWQDFRNGFYEALAAEGAVFSGYRRLVFLTKRFTNPILEEMKEGIFHFAESRGMQTMHQHTLFSDKDIQGKIEPATGDVFFILDENLLVATMDACKANGLAVGTDVGIIAINDGPLYDHLSVPISVLTADFYAMGVAAARYVMSGTVDSAPIKTRLIVRQSLQA